MHYVLNDIQQAVEQESTNLPPSQTRLLMRRLMSQMQRRQVSYRLPQYKQMYMQKVARTLIHLLNLSPPMMLVTVSPGAGMLRSRETCCTNLYELVLRLMYK